MSHPLIPNVLPADNLDAESGSEDGLTHRLDDGGDERRMRPQIALAERRGVVSGLGKGTEDWVGVGLATVGPTLNGTQQLNGFAGGEQVQLLASAASMQAPAAGVIDQPGVGVSQALYSTPARVAEAGLQCGCIVCLGFGAPARLAEADNTYTFDPSKPFILTLSDSGGKDTVDATNWPRPVTINLKPGAFSSFRFPTDIASDTTFNSGRDNVSIAVDTWIEDAVGGESDDQLTGNQLANTLSGGAGSDLIDGDAGTDSVKFAGPRSAFTIAQQADGRWRVTDTRTSGSQGSDVVGDIELIVFDDQTLKLPDDSFVAGQLHHWKSNLPLSGVALEATAPSGPLFSIRKGQSDVDGKIRAELWAESTGFFDFFNVAIAWDGNPQFTFTPSAELTASSLPSEQLWSIVGATDQTTGQFVVSGSGIQELLTTTTGAHSSSARSGEVFLGTFDVALPIGNTRQLFSVARGALGEERATQVETLDPYSSAIGEFRGESSAQGEFNLGYLPLGVYDLQMTRRASALDVASAITSSDVMAALKLAFGRNPNPDPDGPGPEQALPVSPYQMLAADIDGDGEVDRHDAEQILLIAQGHASSANAPEWVFVPDLANASSSSAAGLGEPPGRLQVTDDGVLHSFVAVLRGDVDGSWSYDPPPTLTISSNTTALKGGETAVITFSFSKDPGDGFVWDGLSGDVSVTGGRLGQISGTGLTRTAIFTPAEGVASGRASVSVSAGAYTDSAGNAGSAGRTPVLEMDTLAPTIDITSDKSVVEAGESVVITFLLSEPAVDFSESDIAASGGALSNFNGSGTSYSATYTPAANGGATGSITVASGKFSDAAGNPNNDGTDPNNSVSLTFVPTTGDTTAPVFQSASTSTDGTKVVLTYSEALNEATAASSAFAVTVGGVAATVSSVAVSGSTMILTLANAIQAGQAVTVGYTDPSSGDDLNAVQDAEGNDAVSLAATAVARPSDTQAPTFVGKGMGAGPVSVALPVELIFSEDVRAGSGNIVITNGADTRIISVTDPTQVRFSGNTLTINPTLDLNPNGTYHVTFLEGVVKDAAGNSHAGLSDTSAVSFTTGSLIYAKPLARNGNTTGSGTQDDPYKSIGYASGKALAGDTIYVLDTGTTVSNSYDLVSRGAAGSPVTIKPAPGASGAYTFDSFNAFSVAGAQNLVIEGFEFYGKSDLVDHWTMLSTHFWDASARPAMGGIAINVVTGSNITIRDNYFHDLEQKAVNIESGRYVVISDNIIRDVATKSTSGGHGIMRQQGTGVFGTPDDSDQYRWKITGNLIYNVEQRIYSWTPSKGYANFTLDEGKPINIDETSDKNMKALISDNILAFGSVDSIRLKSTANLEVSNNVIYTKPGAVHADGITDAAILNDGTDFIGMIVRGNAVMTAPGAMAFELNDGFPSNPQNSNLANNVMAGGGGSTLDNTGDASDGIVNLGPNVSLFNNPMAGDFSLRPDLGLAENIGVSAETLSKLALQMEKFNVTFTPTTWIDDPVRNTQVLIDALPGTIFNLASRSYGNSIKEPGRKAFFYNVIGGQEAKNGGMSTLEIVLPPEYATYFEGRAVDEYRVLGAGATLTATATGVLGNDGGTDTKTVTAIRTGGESQTGTNGSVGQALAGTYGTLTLNADGSYTYVANQSAAASLTAGATVKDIFTYTRGGAGSDTAQLEFVVVGKAGNSGTDTIAPAAGVLSIVNKANAQDGIFDLSVSGQEAGANVVYQVSTNGSTWIDTTSNQNLAAGSYQFRVKVTDAAGNYSYSDPVVGTVAPAVTPPVVIAPPSTTTPAAPVIRAVNDDLAPVTGAIGSGGVTNDTTPTLTITATSGSTVRVFDHGAFVGMATATDTPGTYTFTPSAALWAGSHNFTAKASDAHGNLSAASSTYGISVGVTGSGASDSPHNLTLTLASRDGHSDTAFTLVVGGYPVAGSGQTVVFESYGWKLASGTWTTKADWNAVAADIPSLPSGVQFRAKIKDSAGDPIYFSNPLYPATSGLVLPAVDTTTPSTPVITNTGPEITESSKPTLTITAEAGSVVRVFDGAVLLGVANEVSPGNFSFTPPAALADGDHSFYARAIDAAGNSSGFNRVYSLRVSTGPDLTAPQAPVIVSVTDNVESITGNLANGGLTDDATPTLRVTAESGSTVRVFDGTTLLGSATETGTGTGIFSFTPATALATGSHTLTATATDAAGNVSAASVAFSVNVDTTASTNPGPVVLPPPGTAAPAAPVISAVNGDPALVAGVGRGSITDDTTPTLTITAAAGSTVRVFDQGVYLGNASEGAAGIYTFAPAPLWVGNHAFTAKVSDAAGNLSAASANCAVNIGLTMSTGAAIGLSQRDSESDGTFNLVTGGDLPSYSSIVWETASGANTSSTQTNLEPGTYSFRYKLKDSSNKNVLISDYLHVSVAGSSSSADTTPPATPTITATGSTTESLQPTITIKAEAGSVVRVFDGAKLLGVATENSAGNYSFTPATALADGDHSFYARATDAAGNSSGFTSVYSLNIYTGPDVIAPVAPVIASVTDDVAAITGNLTTGGLTNDVTPALTITAEAGSSVKVYDGQTLLGTATETGTRTGTFSFTPSTALTAGSHALTATATDEAGNTSAASVAFNVVVDVTPPVAGTLTLSNKTDDYDNSFGLALTGQESESTVVYLVSINGGNTWSITAANQNALGLGNYQYRAVVTDAAGNTATTAAISTSVLDNTPPNVPAINAVADDFNPVTGNVSNGGVSNDTSLTLNITAEAGSTVKVYDGETLLGTAAETGNRTGTFSFTPSTALAAGSHALTATATDASGNTSGASVAFNVIVDATPPVAGTLTLSNKADDYDNSFSLALSGQEPDSTVVYQVSTNGGNTWSATSVNQNALGLGSYQYRAVVTDLAGNSATTAAISTSVLDNVPPNAPVITAVTDDVSPVTGQVSNGVASNDTSLTLNITAEAGSAVEVFDGGTSLGIATETSVAGTFQFTAATLAVGNHSFTAKAKDPSNNTSAASTAFVVTIDTTSPVAGTLSIIDKSNSVDNTFSLLLEGQEQDATVVYQQSTDAGNTWTDVITNRNGMAGGSYRYRAVVKDAAGNSSTTAEISTVVTDATPMPIGTNVLLTHNATASGLASTGNVASVVGFQSAGGGVVAFTANDASQYGNGGASFVDGSTTVADLMVTDASTGRITLISRGTQAGNSTSVGRPITYGGISADARYVVFGSSSVTSFGNNGVAFSDTNTSTSGSYSDLFVYDLNDGSIRLATATGTSSATSSSQEANYIGITGDSKYLIYTTPFAQFIAGFTRSTSISNTTASVDVIAYHLETGARTLISHSALTGNTQTMGGGVTSVTLSKDGKYVLFAAADATRFGNSEVAFGDTAKTAQDIFAVSIRDGKTQLLSHVVTDAKISAGVDVSLVGQSDSGAYAFLSVNNAAAFGFQDSDTSKSDLIAVRLSDGQLSLVSHAASGLLNSAATNTGFVRATDRYAYFWTEDATKLGATGDGAVTGKDLYRYDLNTGAVLLLSRNSNDGNTALPGNFQPTQLILSADERYVAFTQDAPKGTYGRFANNSGDAGNMTFVVDTQTGAINLVNHSGNSKTTAGDYTGASYQAWGGSTVRGFSADGSTLVFDSGFVGYFDAGFSSSGEYDRGIFGYDTVTGKLRLLSHSADATNNVQGSDANFLGMTPDGAAVLFSAANATKFGNAGVAFTDGAPTLTDIFSVNIATGKIELISGVNGASLGTAATFVGLSETGAAIYKTGNVNGLVTPSGGVADSASAGEDLIGSRFGLLDLVAAGDTAGGVDGSFSDNITSAHSFTLRATVKPNQQVDLLDNNAQVATATANAAGLVDFKLTDVADGTHAYSLRDTVLQGPLVLAGRPTGANLTVTVKPDITPPQFVDSLPWDGALAVAVDANIVLTFSEGIKAGTNGSIRIYKADGSLVETFAANSSALTFTDRTLTINPTANLPHSSNLYVQIDAGAITDRYGVAFAGINNAATLNFSTPDGTAPVFTSPVTYDVAEKAQVIYTASAADSVFATNGLVSYALTANAGDASLLDIHPQTGVVSLKSGATAYQSKTSYSFTALASDANGNVREQAITVAVDRSPYLVSSNPSDGGINHAVNADLVLTFSENISRGTGVIALCRNDGTVVQTFDASSSTALTYSGSTLTINPASALVQDAHYYLQIAPTAVKDSIGNAYAGLQQASALNFSTGLADVQGPVLLSTTPADNTANVDIGVNITLTFSEVIAKGSGTIRLYSADGTLVESFDAASSARLSITGKTLTINPTWELQSNASFYVMADAGSVVDASGNGFAGISDSATLSFSTAAETFNTAGAAKMLDALPGTASEAIGDHTALYITVTYSDEVFEPQLAFRDAIDMEEVARFYQENSMGRMSVSTTYTPLIVLPMAWRWMEDKRVNDMWGLGYELARSLGYDSSAYNVSLVYTSGTGTGPSLGGGNSVLLGWGGVGTTAHEMGHAFGLGHANLFADYRLGAKDPLREYGNPFDTMGGPEVFATHFGSNFKDQLDWLPPDFNYHNPQDLEAVVGNMWYFPSNGLYRIYAMDAQNYQVERKYGLSFQRTSSYSQNLDLEYRPEIKALQSSVIIVKDNASNLVDVTPDTTSLADSGIRLGTTFKLPGLETYVSVVSQGNGYMEVATYTGPFPDNVGPTAAFTISTGKLTKDRLVEFNASARDANGDALLYSWVFSDGVYGSGANYSRWFSDASLSVTATLTVSDMHGGSVTHSYTLKGSNADTPVTVGSLGTETGSALAQVSVLATDAFAAEGGDTGSFVFTRTGGNLNQDLVVRLSYNPLLQKPSGVSTLSYDLTQAGFVDNASDLVSSSYPSTVTIPAGQRSATLTVTPTDDAVIEGLEQVVVTITSDAAYNISSNNASARVTVTDNDTPLVSIKTIDGVASEGGRDSGMVLVTRTGSVSQALSVYYTVSGSAFNGSDYGLLRGEVVIPAGASSAAITVQPVDDNIGELDESVVIALASLGNTYNVDDANDALVTVMDNQDRAQVSVSYSEARDEFSSPQFVVRGIGSRPGTVTVNYTVSGTATSGVDFIPLSGSLTLPTNGNNEVAIPISVIADTIAEPVETIVVKLSSSDDYLLANEATATARLYDDVAGQRVGVTREYNQPIEGSSNGGFYIYRAGPSTTGNLTVSYSLSGTATAGSDYTGTVTTGTVTIPSGSRGVNLSLTPTDDSIAEGMETVTLTLNSGTGYSLDLVKSATQKITDNDASVITVGFETLGSVVQEVDGLPRLICDVKVVLSGPAQVACSVAFQAGGGSATGNQVDWGFLDANNNPITGGTVSFAVGEQSKTIRVVVNNDRVREPGEYALLQLIEPVRTSLTTNHAVHQLNIFDELPELLVKEERWGGSTAFDTNTWDAASAVYQGYLQGFATAQYVADNYSRRLTGEFVAPTTGEYTFYIAADDRARLYLSTDDSAANKVQIANLTSWTGHQAWNALASQKSVAIQLKAGERYYLEVQHLETTGGDHVSVAWEGPGFAVTPLGNPVTVADVGNRYVRMLTSGNSVHENDGSDPMLMAVLDRPAGEQPITVGVQIAGGTAAQGSDYTLNAQSITFLPGEQSKLIPLSLLTDSVGEVPETIRLKLTQAEGAIVLSASEYEMVLLDQHAPKMVESYGEASVTTSTNATVAHAAAKSASGRTIVGWEILSGNPIKEGQGQAAFAIDSSGNIILQNMASLPLGVASVELVVRATDNLGAANDTRVHLTVNGVSGLIEERWTYSSASEETNFEVAPNYEGVMTGSLSLRNSADAFVRKLTGQLKPTVSGSYTFWLAADDEARLYLGSSPEESSKTKIAFLNSSSTVNGNVAAQSWDKFSSQKSISIDLVAGQSYWFEVQHADISGDDHVSVAWAGPGISRQVIPATAFAPIVSDTFADDQSLTGTYKSRVANYTISDTIATDTGAVASIQNGGFTRDATLTLNGSADPGSKVTVYSGNRVVGEAVAASDGTWRLTTVSLDEGLQSLTARVTDASGNIATTRAISATVRSWNSLNVNALLSSDEASGAAATDGDVAAVKVAAAQSTVALQVNDASRYGNSGTAFTDSATSLSDIILVNAQTGMSSLVSAGITASTSAGVNTTLVGLSPNGRFVVFGTSSPSAFGNGATRFTDTQPASISPYSDLIVYDSTNGTMKLVTHKLSDANETNNKQANYVGMSADSRYVLFTQPTVTDLGYGFTNQSDAQELLAYDITTGALSLLSHNATSGNTAASQAGISNVRLSTDGKYAFFTANDATKLGNSGTAFTDSATGASDVFSVDLSSKQIRLLSSNTASGYSTTSAGVSVTYLGQSQDGGIIYVETPDASKFGLTGGSGENILGINLSTGAKTLLAAIPTSDTNSNDPHLVFSDDRRYIALGVEMDFSKAGQYVPGWTGVNGKSMVVYDTVSKTYAMANHVGGNLTSLSYQAWGGPSAKGFTADEKTLVFSSSFLGYFNTGFSANDGHSGLVAYDLATGEQRLLTHTADASNKFLAANTTFEAMTPDGKWVLWSADDASKFGNQGVAFTDSNPTGKDLFATNLETGVIRLLSGLKGESTGGSSVFNSLSADGNTAYFTNTNISTLGPFSDSNPTGADLVGFRLNLLDLATGSDNTAGNGTVFDNVTSLHDLVLSALLAPNQQAYLFDGQTNLGAATADASGQATWALTDVATGTHDYTVVHMTELVPFYLYDYLAPAHLRVVVL